MLVVNSITNCIDHELFTSDELLTWLENSYIFYYSCSNCTKCNKCKKFKNTHVH